MWTRTTERVATVEGVVVVGAAAREDFYELVVVGGVGMSCHLRGTVLEQCEGPGEFLVRGEAFGVVYEVEFALQFAEIILAVECGRIEFEGGARGGLGIN